MFDIEDETLICCLNSKVPTYVLSHNLIGQLTVAIGKEKRRYGTIAWFVFDLNDPTCINKIIDILKLTEFHGKDWWELNKNKLQGAEWHARE